MTAKKKCMESVAIYLRVSTNLQDTLSQMDAINAWLKALPPEKRPKSVRTFQDQGRSGADDDRPGFLTMLAAAKAGEIDTVIAFNLDRISRSANTAIRTILDLDAWGVAFISTSQPVLNLGHENPFRRTMLAAFAEIAEIERTITVSRIKAGLEAAKRRGQKLGKPYLPEAKKQLIRELNEKGYSRTLIQHQAKVGRMTVWRVLKSESYNPPANGSEDA